MSGFFSKSDAQCDSRPNGRTNSCASCGRYRGCKHPKKPFQGEGDILNLVAAPNRADDISTHNFTGSKYTTLRQLYRSLGISLKDDCINGFAVRCYSSVERTTYEFECCRKHLLKDIKNKAPKVIVVYGADALYALIGHRWKKNFGNIHKWRGYAIPDQELGCWIVPTFSLTFVDQDAGGAAEVLMKQDLSRIPELLKTEFPVLPEFKVHYLGEDLSILDTIQAQMISFDYETTGLKPHAKGHKIYCASVAISNKEAYSFPMPKSKEKREPFLRLLRDKNISKVAHNKKYEHTWSIVKLKTRVVNWLLCTQIGAHLLNSQEGTKSLKFQGYVTLGIVDYDSDIHHYLLGTDDKNANSINTIHKLLETKMGLKQLLKYCAWDSIIGYSIAEKQIEAIYHNKSPLLNEHIREAYELFHEGNLRFADAEMHGLRIDTDYIDATREKLDIKIRILDKRFKETEFYQKWRKSRNGDINVNSSKQLGDYLYTTLKLTSKKKTKKGNNSTDADTLSSLKIPALALLAKKDKLMKLRDTFLKGIWREQVRGILHPFFNLTTVWTYRSSSNSINFQNLPKRDKYAMTTIRSAIYPTKGNQLIEMDFSGVEVGIAASYCLDPNLIAYVTDPTKDMHKDVADQIFFLDKVEMSKADRKTFRGTSKNGFVFPQFYGSYYKNCASNICDNWMELPSGKWKVGMGRKMLGGNIADQLIKHGIDSSTKFEQHLKTIEDDFWLRRFKVYNAWRKSNYKKYCTRGYIHTKTGFTLRGYLTENQVGNSPIQGSAFHCLLWTLNTVAAELEKRGMKSRVIGQIHDAVVLDVYPPELKDVFDLVIEVGTVRIKEHFKWIKVPLSLDAELCPVDANWSTKEDWSPYKKKVD